MEPQFSIFPERHVVYASFGERLLAAIIDGILTIVVAFILNLILPVPEFVISIVFYWLYYAIMESGTWQATVGKRAMGIVVTGMNGERISFLNATGRYFAKILSFIILLIGYLMVLWDEKRQGLHDKLANTLVVKS